MAIQALPFLLMGVQAAKTLYGTSRAKRAERRSIAEIDSAIGSIEPTIQGLESRSRGINEGAAIDQQMLDLQMQQSRLASRQRSLSNIENLREVLSSQRALFAARGQSIGQGPAVYAAQKSINQFGREETARRINQKYGELAIKGHKALTELNRGYSQEQIGIEKGQLRDRQRFLGEQRSMIRSAGKRSRRETLFGTGFNLANTFLGTLSSPTSMGK